MKCPKCGKIVESEDDFVVCECGQDLEKKRNLFTRPQYVWLESGRRIIVQPEKWPPGVKQLSLIRGSRAGGDWQIGVIVRNNPRVVELSASEGIMYHDDERLLKAGWRVR